MADMYRLNAENKMVIDELWQKPKPSPAKECDYCGTEYEDEAFDGCCLMCFAKAKTALSVAHISLMTKEQVWIILDYLTTV